MLTMLTSLLLSATFAEGPQTIYVPKNGTAVFTVEVNDLVRIPASAIAGSVINFKVTGPAKLLRVNKIIELTDGKAMLGNTRQEAEIQPTGSGKVRVAVAFKYPNAEMPEQIIYQFDVK